jgi:molecular chaperone GrpE
MAKKSKKEVKSTREETSPQHKSAAEEAQAGTQTKQNEMTEEALPDPVEKLQQELALLSDKYLRLYSDFENFRKRQAKEKLDLLANASEGLIVALLPVLDDFDRALKTLEERPDEDPVAEGVKLIHSKFLHTLKQKGLEPADAMGKDFDTDFHEAITSIPAPSEELKGKVVDVTEKGYLLNGKVIRYAKVVVGN